METLVLLLYLLGFFVIGGMAFAFYMEVLRVDAPAFANMFLMVLFVGVVSSLWLFFGDGFLYWFFGWFHDFGGPGRQSVSFSDHPVIWLVHLFAYPLLTLVWFVSFLLLGIFLPNGKWGSRFYALWFFSLVPTLIYWHAEGMRILVSWFA